MSGYLCRKVSVADNTSRSTFSFEFRDDGSINLVFSREDVNHSVALDDDDARAFLRTLTAMRGGL